MKFRPQLLLLPSHLGAVLRSSRRARKASQTDVARSLGLSQARVSYLEQHPEDVSVGQLMAWCSALGLELYVGPRGAAPEPGSNEDATRSAKPAW